MYVKREEPKSALLFNKLTSVLSGQFCYYSPLALISVTLDISISANVDINLNLETLLLKMQFDRTFFEVEGKIIPS